MLINKLKQVDGTSFSCPLVTGFVACAWQRNRDLTNMELFEEIQKSANLYPYYDYAHGYGIPQASYFILNKTETEPTFSFANLNGKLKVIVDKNAKNVDLFDQGFLYYHISNNAGELVDYKVLKVYQEKVLELNVSELKSGQIIRVHYKGYTNEYKIL